MMNIHKLSLTVSGLAKPWTNKNVSLGHSGLMLDRGICLKVLILLTVFGFPFSSMAEEATQSTQVSAAPEFFRQVVDYPTPDLSVIRQDGKRLSFAQEMNDGRPVIMNFIFASCSAICPMLSHTFKKIQSKLDSNPQKAHLMSISIDPENDTPATLSEYAKKFSAGPDWDFYTSTREVSINLQKAFNVYRGDKMNHTSVILIRVKPGVPWVRLEGFMNADMVVGEYQKLLQN
jgi:protein SCO1/2